MLVITIVLTELLTNTAAAALMVPIALSVAAETGSRPADVAVIAVLIGASCSFLSPIGYQTNLMVYGLGGYRFTDFARVGFPLTVATVATATIALWSV